MTTGSHQTGRATGDVHLQAVHVPANEGFTTTTLRGFSSWCLTLYRAGQR